MPSARFIPYALVAFSLFAPLAHGSLVWRPGEGWSDESGGDVSASSSRDQLQAAQKLEAQGQRDDAVKAYKSLLRRWPLSFFAPEAQYHIGKIMEDEGDFYNAFQAFQKMVTKYPSSTFFEQALDEQFRIANLYLAGEPQRIWKIPVGPSMDRTVEMYERIIKNAPYGTHAAECQFNIGRAREQQRRYTDAVDSYQKVLDNYPTSPVASNAQYQIGYAWMHASQTGDYDMGAAKKAVEAFQDYLVRYPTSDKADQAQDNIQNLGKKQTQGAFDIARFYETQHTPEGRRAAFIYYNEVVREDPNSAQAQQAKKRIQELRPLVEAMPGGAGPDGSPQVAATAGGTPSPQPVSTGSGTAPSDAGTPSIPNASPLPSPSASTPGDLPTPAPSTASSTPEPAPAGPVPDSTPLPQ